MTRWYKIALLVLLTSPVMAQVNNPARPVDNSPPPPEEKKDTAKVKPSFIPTGIRVGTDLIAIGKTIWDDTYSGWEVNADVDFHRYFLVVDYGTWARKYPSDTISYANDGRYWRVGVDVNFLKNDPDRNVLFFGLRYGRSTFDEQLSIVNESVDYWGSLDGSYTNDNMSAHWMELTGGLRVKIWKMIWMGYTARFKFGLSTDKNGTMIPYDVPGYGLTDRDSYWGFNYQIMVRIPVRKSPVVATKK